jgi:hypothetical protein
MLAAPPLKEITSSFVLYSAFSNFWFLTFVRVYGLGYQLLDVLPIEVWEASPTQICLTRIPLLRRLSPPSSGYLESAPKLHVCS